MTTLTERQATRFWEHVDRSEECWTWTSHKNSGGYGRYAARCPTLARVVNHYAHRVAYELSSGPIPDGLTIDHLCRNPSCVKPAHLEAVPQVLNTRRAMRKPLVWTDASIVTRARKDGGVSYRVMCRPGGTTDRQRTRTFRDLSDAEHFVQRCRDIGTAEAWAELE